LCHPVEGFLVNESRDKIKKERKIEREGDNRSSTRTI
jgi:hypothetical protein